MKTLYRLLLASIVLAGTITPHGVWAQDTLYYSLEQVVARARAHSPAAKRAQTFYNMGQWRDENFRREFLPSVRMNTTLPNFSRSIRTVTQPDGQDVFVEQFQANSSLSLSASQKVWFTGGILSVSANASRIDQFGATRRWNYSGSPFNLSYSQQFFAYNPYPDERRLNQLQLEQTSLRYLRSLESVSAQATQLFFGVFSSQERLRIERQNIANFDTLYKISKERLAYNRVAESDVLQLEINKLQAAFQASQLERTILIANRELAIFLGLDPDQYLVLSVADSLPEVNIALDDAVTRALAGNRDVDFEIRRLQQDINYERATGNLGPVANISVSLGANGAAPRVQDLYSDLSQSQSVGLTLQMPLITWGVNRNKFKLLEAERTIESISIEQDQAELEKSIMQEVSQLGDAQREYNLLKRSFELADTRYKIIEDQFLAGIADIAELNRTTLQRYQLRRRQINILGSYWAKYYTVRALTLFDYVNNRPLAIAPF